MRNRTNIQLEEISGLLGLGMEKECVCRARAVLRMEALDAYGFVSCLDAVLICADRLRPWKNRIELAFARLGRNEQRKARNKLFHFYVALAEWKSALKHRPLTP